MYYLLNCCPEGIPLDLMKEGLQELHIKFSLALLDFSVRNGQGEVVGGASLGVALQKVVGEESHT